MRHLDLFAGIGGFSLAAQWMGWETIAQVEWDEWCQKVLAKNFPDALRFGDIVEFNKMLQKDAINRALTEISNGKICCDSAEQGLQKCEKEGIKESVFHAERTGLSERFRPGSIDIITGGFPCQPFSHAGKRKGTDDSRYLWPAMLETIRRVKPAYVVGENVAGLVSMENGKTLDRILSDLEDEGYTIESFIIPACALGAWHRRDRIWIIAHSERTRTRNNSRKISDEEWRSRQSWGEGVRQGNGKARTDWISSTGENGVTPDSHNKRQQAGGERSITSRQEWPARGCYEGARQWQSESRLGGMAYGLPYWVDGYWDREPEGVPRVATGVNDRVNRLKGLGNAIVPQIALQLFKAIAEYKNI